MTILRRAAAILAAVGGLAAGEAAVRAAPSARLVYVRGPGAERCPSEAAVRAAVSARLGYDPFLDWARETMFVEIQRGPRAFRVRVKLVGTDNLQRGAREIAVRGDDCSAVIDAMGLSISLAIDAGAGARREEAPVVQPSPAPSAPAPAQAVPSATAAVIAPAAPPPPRAALTLRVGAGVLGTLNAAPSSTAGATLFVGARWRALSLDLEGRADAPVAGDSDLPAVGVQSWLLAGAVVPCGHVRVAFGCVVLAAGRIGATARNVPVAVERHGPWSAAGGRAGVEWAVLPAVSVQAYAQVLATLTRDTLWVDAMRVYTIPAWSAGLGLAVAWRFL